MPEEVVIGYVANENAVQLKEGGISHHDLKPLWTKGTFLRSTSILSGPSKSIQRHNSQLKSTKLPFLQRKKPKHLEFFPTGFQITAFPTLLAIVGLTGYGTFKAAFAFYRIANGFYQRSL